MRRGGLYLRASRGRWSDFEKPARSKRASAATSLAPDDRRIQHSQRSKRTEARRSMRYGGALPSWLRQSRSVRPERNSRATRQTTSGRSPGREINSKSNGQISSNGNSLGVTAYPLLEEGVFEAIEEATLVAKCQLEDPRRLEVRPGRIGKAVGRRGKDFVAAIL